MNELLVNIAPKTGSAAVVNCKLYLIGGMDTNESPLSKENINAVRSIHFTKYKSTLFFYFF